MIKNKNINKYGITKPLRMAIFKYINEINKKGLVDFLNTNKNNNNIDFKRINVSIQNREYKILFNPDIKEININNSREWGLYTYIAYRNSMMAILNENYKIYIITTDVKKYINVLNRPENVLIYSFNIIPFINTKEKTNIMDDINEYYIYPTIVWEKLNIIRNKKDVIDSLIEEVKYLMFMEKYIYKLKPVTKMQHTDSRLEFDKKINSCIVDKNNYIIDNMDTLISGLEVST